MAASAMTRAEMIRTIKKLAGTSGVVFVLAHFVPDVRSPYYKNYQIKQYEKEVEEVLAIHRDHKRKDKN